MATPLHVHTALAVALIVLVSAPLNGDGQWSRYRGVTLGDSVATAVERLEIAEPTIKVLYERPFLVQELTWRPHRFISGVVVTADPLGELVLTFMDGRLVRMTATYDRDRTEGLSDADFVELLGAAYGLPRLESRPTGLVRAEPRRTIASWGDDDALVQLWSEQHPRRVGLTITSSGDIALQTALADGRIAEREAAPQRELARQAAAAAALKEREEKTRLANIANFKP
jgi:hypothetical protein